MMMFVVVVCGVTAAVMFAVAGAMASEEHPSLAKGTITVAFATLQALAAVFALAEVLR